MKKFLLILVLSIGTLNALAQQKQTDSLKQLLRSTKADTSRAKLLVELSRKYYLKKPDSGLIYATQALTISKRIGNKSGQVHALSQIGFSLWLLGNRPAALETFIASLNIATAINDQWSIARNYDGMSCVYSEQGEVKTGIAYAHKAEIIFAQLHDYENVVDELMDLSDFYGANAKPDSSLYYSKKALELSVKINEFTWHLKYYQERARSILVYIITNSDSISCTTL